MEPSRKSRRDAAYGERDGFFLEVVVGIKRRACGGDEASTA
jgi:hypothetical protein